MVYEVKNFSPYEDRRFLVRAEGRNISAIHDRLIRLAAKITENYAGDIFHEMVRLREALVEGNKEFWVILGFRESGVDALPAPRLAIALNEERPQGVWILKGSGRLSGSEYHQFWSLRHVPATTKKAAQTTLVRIDLCRMSFEDFEFVENAEIAPMSFL